MYHKVLYRTTLFFVLLTMFLQAQERDSLLKLYANAKQDTIKLDALNDLAWYYMSVNPDSALYYSNLQLQKAQAIKNEKKQALAYLNLGSYYLNVSNVDKSLENYFKAIDLFIKVDAKKSLARAYANVGLVYYSNSDFINAIDYQYKSLKMREQLKDDKGAAKTLLNIGNIYYDLKQIDNALVFFEKSSKIYRKLQLSSEEANVLMSIASVYKDKERYDDAIVLFEQALQLFKNNNDKQSISNVYSNMALVYAGQKKYEKAIEYNQLSLNIDKELQNYRGLAISYVNLASIYRTLDNANEVKKILKSLEELFPHFDNHHIKKEYYELSYWVSKKEKNYAMALEFFEKTKFFSDSILKEENSKEIIQKQFKYEYEKKAEADSLKVADERKLAAAQLKQEQTMRFGLYGGLSLVIVFAGFMYNRFRVTNKQKKIIELKEKETQQQKHIIEEKHKEITDSINYAERIQRSFLATKELLDENLKDYFVLFQPKDVVSGDFFWAKKLNNDTFALVTADSTGHGVPGAIMSLLNITSLESAIKDGFNEPAAILNATRNTIIDRLKKDGSAEGGKDGMDCCLTIYDFKHKKLIATAANNPIWIVRGTEVIEIKPDKMPVGKHDKQDLPFTQHEINLQQGDVVYTLTDGFPDQFGGASGKKFMSKKLREFLVSNSTLPMQDQKELLQLTFKNWIGNLEQIDDVCIIGVRV